MRRLLLLRHAKSDRPPGVADIDRPLNPRGRRAAPAIAGYLDAEELRPDLAIVSPSARTRETFAAVQDVFEGLPVQWERGIYEAPAAALLAIVRAAPDEAAGLLVVGHNPGLEDLAETLIGSGNREARRRIATQFPTAALAVIAFGVTWACMGLIQLVTRFQKHTSAKR